jgi:hypothetical protein
LTTLANQSGAKLCYLAGSMCMVSFAQRVFIVAWLLARQSWTPCVPCSFWCYARHARPTQWQLVYHFVYQHPHRKTQCGWIDYQVSLNRVQPCDLRLRFPVSGLFRDPERHIRTRIGNFMWRYDLVFESAVTGMCADLVPLLFLCQPRFRARRVFNRPCHPLLPDVLIAMVIFCGIETLDCNYLLFEIAAQTRRRKQS